jgi:hypothetical protein
MAQRSQGHSLTHSIEWARRCKIEAARAIHPSTIAFLHELAGEFEAIAGEAIDLDPDDPELQNAVAERLSEIAARTSEWKR